VEEMLGRKIILGGTSTDGSNAPALPLPVKSAQFTIDASKKP